MKTPSHPVYAWINKDWQVYSSLAHIIKVHMEPSQRSKFSYDGHDPIIGTPIKIDKNPDNT